MRIQFWLTAVAFAFSAWTSVWGGSDPDTYTDGEGIVWTFGYTYSDNTATIFRADTSHAEYHTAYVPETIRIGTQRMPVTGILDGAFDGCANIERVVLVDSVTDVTGFAFRGMGGNVRIVAPDTLEGKLVAGKYGNTVVDVVYSYTAQDIPLTYVNFTKAQTVRGALTWGSTDFHGMVAELKFAKAAKAKSGQPRTVKLNATITGSDGVKQRVKTTLKINADGSTVTPVQFRLKLTGLDEQEFALSVAGGRVSFKNVPQGEHTDCKFAKAKIGGVIDRSVTSLNFYAFSLFDESGYLEDSPPNLGAGWKLLDDTLLESFYAGPFVTFKIQNGRKFVLPKATAVKLKKNKDGSMKITGDVGGNVGTTNPWSLKLTYNVKTGQFKGGFKLYAVNPSQKKLKSYTVKVFGYMIEDFGYGAATLKKPKGGPWKIGLWDGLG